jgi:hypothetical protein
MINSMQRIIISAAVCFAALTLSNAVSASDVLSKDKQACLHVVRKQTRNPKTRRADSLAEDLMLIHLASPMFIAGEVLLGLSITVFIGAFIATVENSMSRSRRR